MSPEQVRGEKLDSRTDIFSFGLVLYEMATRRRAFSGETAPVVHDAILHQEPRPARQLNPKLSPKLEKILGKALQKDRELRYQHVSEISADLKALKRAATTRLRRLLAAVVCVLLSILVAILWIGKAQPTSLPELKQQQLTANSNENPVEGARISPDGKYLVYTDLKGMHLKRLGTGELQDIPRPETVSQVGWGMGSWFPDGKRFLINAWEGGQHYSIWEVSIPIGVPHKVKDNATVWSVSPDGSLVAFTTHRGRIGDREIWLMGPEGEQPRKWLEADENGAFGGVQWFADGRRIIFGRDHQGANAFRTSVETRELTGGPSNTVLSTGPLWENGALRDGHLLPDGRLIYLLGGQGITGPSCNYWEMSLDTRTGEARGKPRQLTNWAGVCMDYTSATADGRRLVFTKWWTERSVYVANLEASGTRLASPRRLTLSDGQEIPTAWTSDSRSVIFESNLNGHLGIFRQGLHEDTAEPVVASIAGSPAVFEDEDRAAARMSPDGTWVVYPVFPKDSRSPTAELMRVSLKGGSPSFVLSAPIYDAPRCARSPAKVCVFAEKAPNGKQLIFTSFDPVAGRGPELARLDIDQGADYDNGSARNDFVWDLSPDGNRIAVLKRREGRIHILSTTGSAIQEITVKGWSNVASLNWAADGKALFVASKREDRSVLLHVDLQGNPKIVWEQKGWIGTQCVASPDGRHLAILAFKLSNNVWMMENF